jgi:uncharacterized surface protein with fasciclin (FAS1) repeats
VLAIPQDDSATTVEAGMEYYKNILTQGSYLTGNANEVNNQLGEEPDMTFFIPNSAKAQQSFASTTSGWTTDELNELLYYHAVPGIVAYSSSMHDGSVLPTVQGAEITIHMGPNGSIYANDVKILATDYLISNGVMHILDGQVFSPLGLLPSTD